MERRFGKPHPEMEGFKDPPPALFWVARAFFRLHRRRQLTDHGFQPLPLTEIADMADRIIEVPASQRAWFCQVMEEADNAVLYDHYTKVKSATDSAKKDNPKRRGKRK